MTQSKIEWTGRSDWNPIRGCTRVSPGCGGPGPHGGCYAEAIAGRFSDPGQAFHGFARRAPAGGTNPGGRWTGKVEIVEDRITLPLRWKKPALIFASSTSDFFHEKLSDEDIDRLFAVMALAPQHTFQILTKRADRMRGYFADKDRAISVTEKMMEIDPATPFHNMCACDGADGDGAWPLPNIWLGVSVEDQQRADERREDLRNTPAAVRFVSYEPALGAVDWSGWEFADWIISGGESGLRARPSHPDWHRATLDFCAAHDIAYLFKQWGEWAPMDAARIVADRPVNDRWGNVADWMSRYVIFADDAPHAGGNRVRGHSFTEHSTNLVYRVGKKVAGRLLDGVRHDGMPS